MSGGGKRRRRNPAGSDLPSGGGDWGVWARELNVSRFSDSNWLLNGGRYFGSYASLLDMPSRGASSNESRVVAENASGLIVCAMLPRVALLASLVAAGVLRTRVSSGSFASRTQAPPIANVQTIDLSRLAGPPVSNERSSGRRDRSSDCRRQFRRRDPASRARGEDGRLVARGRSGAIGRPHAERSRTGDLRHMRPARLSPAAGDRHHAEAANQPRHRGRRVNEPGVYQLPPHSSYLLAALVAAGGLAEDAGPKVGSRFHGQLSLGGFPGAEFDRNPVGKRTQSEGVSHVCLNLAESVRGDGGRYIPDGVITVEAAAAALSCDRPGRKPGQFEFPINHEVRCWMRSPGRAGIVFLADKVYVLRSAPDGSKMR